jgi:hypothetical protein
MRRSRVPLRVLGLFGTSLALLTALSELRAPTAGEAAREQATERATALVLDIAERGPGALLRGAKELGAAAPVRSPLLVAAGAWAKLSLARVGLLSRTTSARLPWILLAALGPAAVGVLGVSVLGERRGPWLGLGLLLHPSFALDAVHGSMASASALLAVAATASLGGRTPGAAGTVVATLALLVGMTILPAVVWALPIAVGHHLWVERLRWRRAPGVVSVPAWAAFALIGSPLVAYALSPAHFRRGLPGMAQAWLESLGGRGVFPAASQPELDYAAAASSVLPTFVLLVLALQGFTVTPARRERDSHASALGVIGAGVALVAAALTDAAFGVGPAALLLTLPFVVLLAGFGARSLPRRPASAA